MPPRFELFKIWLLDPRTLRRIGRFKLSRRSLLVSGVAVWMLYTGVMWQLGEQPRRHCATAACRALLGGLPFGGAPAPSPGPAAGAGAAGSAPGGRPAGAPPATAGGSGPTSGSAPAGGPTTTSGGPLATGAAPSTTPGQVSPTTMGAPGVVPPTPGATTTTTAGSTTTTTTTTAANDCKKNKPCKCKPSKPKCDNPAVAPGG